MEAGGGRLWTENLDNVLSLVLVQQHQGHHLLEGPAQQSTVLLFHDGEEEGEMGALTGTIAIPIQLREHIVTESGGVEGCVLVAICK